MVSRIIITDGGDHTVFEWIYGEGITYPTEQMRRKPGSPVRGKGA